MAKSAVLPDWAKAWRADFSLIGIWHTCMRRAGEKYTRRYTAWHDDPRPRAAVSPGDRRAQIMEVSNVVGHSSAMSSLSDEERAMLDNWHTVAEHRALQMEQVIELLSDESFVVLGDAALFIPAYAISEIDRDEQEVLERLRLMFRNLKTQNAGQYRRALHVLLAIGEQDTDVRIQHTSDGHPVVGLAGDFESMVSRGKIA